MRSTCYTLVKYEEHSGNEKESSLSKEEKETQINRNLIYSDKFIRAIQSLNESKECTRTIIEVSRKMLEHHSGDRYEDLYFIDSANNTLKFQDNYYTEIQKVEPTKSMIKMLDEGTSVIGIHNHPNSTIPSLDDFYVCQERGYKYGLVFCHNGSIYKYRIVNSLIDINIECARQIYEKEEYISLTNLQSYDDIKSAHKEHMNELQENLLEAGIEFSEVLAYER